MADFRIVNVDAGNVEEHGFFCVKNKKHPGYVAKLQWLRQRFEEGLRIKMIQTQDNKTAGFLEYIPGEYAWRVVNAPDYLVIHCLWVASNKFPYRGMTRKLLTACDSDARQDGHRGVAVVTSDGPWMAGSDVYLKHGFRIVDEAPAHFQLLTKAIARGKVREPSFPDNWDQRLKKHRGLKLLYTNQCPYVGKAVEELPPVAEQHGVRLELLKLNSAAEARQQLASPYGMVNLVYRGKLLADHPISATRFRNILQKDLGHSPQS